MSRGSTDHAGSKNTGQGRMKRMQMETATEEVLSILENLNRTT